MPTNFSGSLKPLVRVKAGEPCSLKRHFTGCMRQVIGFLDLLANNDPDRLVWVTTASVQKHCKNYRAKGKPPYSLKMVEVCLKALRDKGIISRQHAVELQERRGFVVDHAFVVTPHDALCVKSNTTCRFVGMGEVPGTKWASGNGDVWFVSEREAIESKIVFEVGPGRKKEKS
jgi:hypothetical protein